MKTEYRNKYIPVPKGDGTRGPKIRPERWISGTRELDREKYYAWAKHKAQAIYRREPHSLTFEQWCSLWTDELFIRRGRRATDLCLMLIDLEDGWHYHNVTIVERIEHLKRAREYLDRQRF